MKAIKIILLFIVVLGGIMGAFFLSGKGHDDDIELSPVADSTFDYYRQKFIKDWEDYGDWNDSLFMNHCYTVKQMRTGHDVSVLKDLNRRTATEMVSKKIFEQWASADCDKAQIDRYHRALSTIEREDEGAKNDSVVQKIRNVYKTYLSARNVAHRSIGLNPNFDGTRWNSFTDYSTNIIESRDGILRDRNYRAYLSNITELKNGLNSISVKLADAKKQFYRILADELITHYSQTLKENWDRTRLNELRNHKSRFESEYSSNKDLSGFASQYAAQVAVNELRARQQNNTTDR